MKNKINSSNKNKIRHSPFQTQRHLKYILGSPGEVNPTTKHFNYWVCFGNDFKIIYTNTTFTKKKKKKN